MIYEDKNNISIKDDDIIVFSHPDSQEPTLFNKRATNVKLCFWSKNEQRYIPFSDVFDQHIEEAEIVHNSIEMKKE